MKGPVTYLTSNRAAVRRSKEDRDSRDLAGLRGTADRSRELLESLLVHGRRDERCPDGTRCNGVDTNALGDVLVVESASEGNNSTLSRCVVEQVRAADIC